MSNNLTIYEEIERIVVPHGYSKGILEREGELRKTISVTPDIIEALGEYVESKLLEARIDELGHVGGYDIEWQDDNSVSTIFARTEKLKLELTSHQLKQEEG